MKPSVPCAASSLLCDLLAPTVAPNLLEVARTPVSVHFTTGRDDVPVLCVATAAAVRLPACVVTTTLPRRLAVVDGVLRDGDRSWAVHRWWRPPRPRGLTAPPTVSAPAGVEVPDEVDPARLVGSGPGLTPYGDDVVAGALVAAHAVRDPRLSRWREATLAALLHDRTTAVSAGLLRHAADGWATPQLADFVTATCAGDAGATLDRLLAVGHSSGAGLAAGALHVLGRPAARRVAA